MSKQKTVKGLKLMSSNMIEDVLNKPTQVVKIMASICLFMSKTFNKSSLCFFIKPKKCNVTSHDIEKYNRRTNDVQLTFGVNYIVR